MLHAIAPHDDMTIPFSETNRALDSIIALWTIDLDVDLPFETGTVLSPEEENRADRFATPRLQMHYRNAHVLLRLGLAWYLGIKPQSVQWETTGRGKPVLAKGASLYFNLSHCDHFAVAAFTTVGDVGVDVESLGRAADAGAIAEAHFARDEARWIGSAVSEEERNVRFLRIWTRKEAVLKATGAGIGDSLRQAVVLENSLDLADRNNRNVTWRVEDISLPLATSPTLIGAVAAPDTAWMARVTPLKVLDLITLLSYTT